MMLLARASPFSVPPQGATQRYLRLAAWAVALLTTAQAAAERPKLAVVIIVDQLRADYLDRFRPYFEPGGFERFLADGAVYSDAHYRHAYTATAPGHATLLTGVHADRHGIVANEWYDRSTWVRSPAVADPATALVGAQPSLLGPGGVWTAQLGTSPRRLLASTVGDQLKLRYGDAARVIALGHKDRAPIMMGGRLADGAYWQHEGRFVTSRYYREALPDWVAEFNAEDRIDASFGAPWDRLLPIAVYDSVQGPDDAPGEESRHGLGTTFPRRIDGGMAVHGPAFYDAHRLAAMSNDVLGEFAERAVIGEQLGQREGPDLLCLGFSQLDYTGHSFGPDSHEVMDSVVRLDRVLARLFAFLDREIGAGMYVAVLSADHGVAPLPERFSTLGRDDIGGRFDGPGLDLAVQQAMTSAFGPAPEGAVWALRENSGYHLQPTTLVAKNVQPAAAAELLKQTLLAWPQIAVGWTREELLDPRVGSLDPILAAWRRSFHPDRSPDVLYSVQPYIVDRRPAGTNHGSPYHYDTHVPLAWYGRGVTPGQFHQRVGVDSLAPTLAALLGVPPPPEAVAERLF